VGYTLIVWFWILMNFRSYCVWICTHKAFSLWQVKGLEFSPRHKTSIFPFILMNTDKELIWGAGFHASDPLEIWQNFGGWGLISASPIPCQNNGFSCTVPGTIALGVME
jgi:hypothetical protein